MTEVVQMVESDGSLEVGVRVAVESEKVGVPARQGVVMLLDGPMVRVHWDDGAETSFLPSAGSMQVLP